MESLQEFWDLVLTVWREGIYGVDIGHFLVALGIFLIFLVLRNLLTRVVVRQIRYWAGKSKTTIDDKIIDGIEQPLRFIPLVLGFFLATGYLDVSPEMEQFFYNVNRSLVAFTLFWILYRATGPIGDIIGSADNFLTYEMTRWLVKALRVGFVLIGGAAILEVWGIAVGPLVAGLGLFGVAVALGAQDLFKNLIAGIFVIGEKRFQIGDWIFVDGVCEGDVEAIGFRTTCVRRFDKAPVYVPNAMLSDNSLINFQRMTYRRIKWLVGVEYSTTKEQLEQIRSEIFDYITGSDEFAAPTDASTFVRIDSFNASSIDILVYCFTKTTKWGEWLAVKEKLAYRIKDIVEGAGTGFAFPSRSLYIETFPSDMPEVFPLQDKSGGSPGKASTSGKSSDGQAAD